MLSAVNVTLKERLEDISIDFSPGTFVGVVGGNGAGKSTLARLLVGALAPDSGEIRLDDWLTSTPDGLREIRRKVALVRSDPELQMASPTVYEEVAFALRAAGLDSEEIRQRVERTLELFELTPLADAHPFLISSGQQHKLALAAQIARSPRYLILDEFTGMLDSITRAEVLRWLRNWQADTGACLILITHRLEELRDADAIAVLAGGKLVALDSPREIFRRIAESPQWRVELVPLLQLDLEKSAT